MTRENTSTAAAPQERIRITPDGMIPTNDDLAAMPDESGSDSMFLASVERKLLNLIANTGRDAYITAARHITEKDFTVPMYGVIFLAMYELNEDGENITTYTVPKRLERSNNQAAHVFLHEVWTKSKLQIGDDVEELARTIHNESLRRRLIEQHRQAWRRLQDGADVQEEIQIMRDDAELLLADGGGGGAITAGDAVNAAIERMEREARGEIVRVPTGITTLDRTLDGGLENGSLYCLGAVPNIGKSLFVSQIAINAARQRLPVGIVSLEMRREDLGRRFIAGTAGLTRDELLLKAAAKEFDSLPLWIYDVPMNARQLLAACWELKTNRKARLVCVDFLQLVETSAHERTKYEEVNAVVKQLKAFAMRADVPVLVIVSLTTKQMTTERQRSAPLLSDIRDSGDIGYAADGVLFLYAPDESDGNYIELSISKARNSGRGKPVGLLMNRDTLTFAETARRKNTEVAQRKNTPVNGGGEGWY